MQPLVEQSGLFIICTALQGRGWRQLKAAAPDPAVSLCWRPGIEPGLLFHRIGQQGQMQAKVSPVSVLEILVETLPQLGLVHQPLLTNGAG